MELTILTERVSDGRWRASISELPAIFYLGLSEAEVKERAERLVHALRSEHIKIERILPDGDVILTLRRGPEGPGRPVWAGRPFSMLLVG